MVEEEDADADEETVVAREGEGREMAIAMQPHAFTVTRIVVVLTADVSVKHRQRVTRLMQPSPI